MCKILHSSSVIEGYIPFAYNGVILKSARTGSDVDFTGEDNLLITYANIRRIREVDNNLSTTLFDMTMSSGWPYRSDKMPIYPYSDANKKYSEDNNAKNTW